ncbi:MAG: alpha-amylase [Chlorobi bacterium]|nr:alpha-amylase [Chlorobiota bacterium]
MKRKIKMPIWAKNQTIYEVNLRQFTPGGTFNEFAEHLPRLKEMGVGILWFMPIQPIGIKNRKGTLGSYYSISDYTKANPEFGTLEDFKILVEKIHKLGMYVIIDWVANHTAWDHHWTKDHPGFYTKDDEGNFKAPVKDWEDVIHLDYGNPALWDGMISEMEFWLKGTNIDGFRCDMAHLVPTLFWNRARWMLQKEKDIFMLAESENHDLLEYAFDSIYNWKLLHAMNETAAQKINAADLLATIQNEIEHLPKGSSLLNFTSNHDENSWQGSAIERLNYLLEPLSILTFTIPGTPLIYSGQEAGNYRRLKFFDKDEIEWKADKMSSFYQKLNTLRKTKEALKSGELRPIKTDAPENILAFGRFSENDRVLVFLNLSSKDSSFYVECGKLNGQYRNVFNDEAFEYNCHELFSIGAYAYLVLVI